MVIVVRDLVTDFLLGQRHGVVEYKDFLRRLQTRFQMPNHDISIREMIIQTCGLHLTHKYQDSMVKDLFLGATAAAAAVIADQELFKDAVCLVTNGFDEQTFSQLGRLRRGDTSAVPENR